jgi:magnesium transporter
MIDRYEYQGVTWVDIENPTEDEVDQVADEFNLGLLLPRELLAPTPKPRVDLYPSFAYTVLHFPALRATHGSSATQEVDIVMGKNFIITVHYDTIPAIYDFARSFEAAMLIKHANNGKFHTGHVLLELAERLYQGVENELEALEDNVSSIEQKIFSGHERSMVMAISTASRELLNQKRALATHKEVLESLEQIGVSLFGESLGNYFRAVSAFHFRVYSHAIALSETINELRDTNDSLLSTRQNEIMKNLTIMAFVTFPLTLISSVFGMNTDYLPIVGRPGDFWYIIGGMSALALSFFLYFKYRRWF